MMSNDPDDQTHSEPETPHPADEWWENEGKRTDSLSEGDSGHPPSNRTSTTTGDTLYAWQMEVDDGWNVIGVTMPTGQTLPLVTTSMRVAWEAFEVAQAHANRNQCQVRLMAFVAGTSMAVVVPND